MVLEEPDGLADHFSIDLVSEVGDARNSSILHQYVAKIFRHALPDKHSQNRDGEQCPDTVNPGGEERIQVNYLMSEWVFDQTKSIVGSGSIEYGGKNRSYHQGDKPFRQPDYGKAQNPGRQPYLIRQDVAQ